MNNTRARFEEIWPVPSGVYWNEDQGYCGEFTRIDIYFKAIEWDARLDTFTRCQQTMAPVMSLVDELVQEIESCHADLRKENWYVPRQSALLDRAKQIIGRE